MHIHCKNCHSHFVLKDDVFAIPIQFCPSCGKSIDTVPFAKKETILETKDLPPSSSSSFSDEISLVQGHAPDEKVQFSIGPYQVLRSIGKGGMGEVFLAYDTTCGRRIALKRIREDLEEHKQMHKRFLKEARVTSQLTHPAIIPIYVIREEKDLIYYTMPFVEGETLKTILRDSRQIEKKGGKPHPIGGTIPPLARIFLTICQACAYAHSKGVLHRDLKPENIIVGKYGEVLILDWGLAKLIKNKPGDEEDTLELKNPLHHLTHLGKVVGTISYMAHERAMGMPANIQTDIYSLGVILYQMLTLRIPFKRGSLKEFRQNMASEVLYNPIEVAPYREVPKLLSNVVLKCLSNDASQRYKNVDELIHDIENYLEGRSEWFEVAALNIHQKSDWEFQENVLMAEHIAITREAEVTDWVSLMISKQSFPQNIKIEAEVEIKEKCHGIGFLLSVPEKAERVHLNDGYCLWLGTDFTKSTKLLSSNVEVLNASDLFLKTFKKHKIRIEKIENNIHFYLDNTLQFSYISHKPLLGTHIGMISKDANFSISPLYCYSGSESIEISCLAVPDAFLAHKDFHTALSEYRRIGYSFPGTTEGREAMFRAGITLLEHGKAEENEQERTHYFELAHQEFNLLHKTAGGPLEYLGKALVYEACHDDDEEIKCFELAYRRYPKHPLLPVIDEHVVFRMYENSRANRLATYNFVLLALRFLPLITSNLNSRKLISSLKKNWEALRFLEEDPDQGRKEIKTALLEVVLSFWLAKPYVLTDLIDQLVNTKEIYGKLTITNALFSLILFGSSNLALNKIQEIEKKIAAPYDFKLLRLAISSDDEEEDHENIFVHAFAIFPKNLTVKEIRILTYLLEKALKHDKLKLIKKVCDQLKDYSMDDSSKLAIDYFLIAVHLINKNWNEANEILKSYPLELINQETTALHFLYGCWLYMTEGKEIAKIHFAGALEVSFPRTWTLATHYLSGQLKEEGYWFKHAFMWEKRKLYQQLILFYKIKGDFAKVDDFIQLEKKQYLNLDEL